MVGNKHHWSSGLINAINDSSSILLSSDKAVVIKDKYPKAKYHFLVLPKANLSTIYQLKNCKEHIELLEEIYLLGINIIELIGENIENFKFGFHASPSMQRLHLHVISTDFVSQFLKTKTHWNSFNTDWFIPYENVMAEIQHGNCLKKLDKLKLDSLIATELRCHKCIFLAKNMPNLKAHLLTHCDT